MAENVNFSQWLRPIGQLLEPLGVESFSLQVEDGGVFIRAQKPAVRQAPPAQNVSLRSIWQTFRSKGSETAKEPQTRWETVELRYTDDDIARMETEAKSKRSGAGGSPEAHALAQILRSVGAFVDQKQGRLIGITKEGQDIAIDYESVLRRNLHEKFTVSSLYDYWVRMYLRRRERS
jgi:hypothetical protein